LKDKINKKINIKTYQSKKIAIKRTMIKPNRKKMEDEIIKKINFRNHLK
jgi:hypothetical protein